MTIARVMLRLAREAMTETIQEYAEPLAWIAGKFAGLARRRSQTTGRTWWSERVFYDDKILEQQEYARRFLLRVTEGMTPRQVHALMLYFGFEPKSEDIGLEEISALTGVSVEELRALREVAFERIRRLHLEAPPIIFSRKLGLL